MAGGGKGKLREAEARILALKIAADQPGREATTAQIKDLAPAYRELSPEDLKPSVTRPCEQKWQQILGNAVGSHRNSSTSVFTRGLAERIEGGLRVTGKGLDFLKNKKL